MDSMGLPMSFGKKAKGGGVALQSKVDKTKRAVEPEVQMKREPEASGPSEPGPSTSRPAGNPDSNGNGEKAVRKPEEDEDDDEDFGPMPPPSALPGSKRKAEGEAEVDGENEDDDDDDDEDDLEDDEVDRIPISNEIILKDHTKVCSALAVDPSGARVATGSHDYDAKIWDFGGMDARLKPFKSWEPNGNYYIHDVDYSPDGQSLLVISGTLQPKMYNRNGEEGVEFNKGDVYLRDMKNTSGHTAEINGGNFHPTDKDQFVTCSNDSTLRIWDVNNKRKQKHVIVVKSKERGARTRVTCCAWSPDGKYIAGACIDGTLHVWDTASNLARPYRSCETAHEKGTETTGVAFSRDSSRLASRGGDGTVKLWDVKNMRKPLAVASGLENRYSEADLAYSPDGKTIIVGLSAGKGEKGALVFLSSDDLSEQRRVPVGEGSVIRVLWHSRINQIFATLSTGAVHVLYSPRSSIHGALLPLKKMPKTAPRDMAFTSADLKPVIFTPDALPQFQDKKYGESQHQRDKRAKKMKPMEPVTGAGKGGRLGASATASFVQTLFPDKIDPREDPREALLKYAREEDKEKH